MKKKRWRNWNLLLQKYSLANLLGADNTLLLCACLQQRDCAWLDEQMPS